MTTPVLPNEFIEHLKSQGLAEKQVPAFIEACQTPLRKSVRVNTLKLSVGEFKQRALAWGWELTPIPWCDTGFWIARSEQSENNESLGNFIEHLQGGFYIQESSSMIPPEALNFIANDLTIVLDMAAAPGSKTTQLAALMNNTGTLVANELSSSRVKVLHSSIQRCGVSNVILTHQDGRVFGERCANSFDAILLDAPCGGEGTVRKDPDAMSNWSFEALNMLSNLQKELIISAYHALRPGGTLVYSTCTLSKEENQQVCDHLLLQCSDMQPISLENLYPEATQCLTAEGYLHVFPHIYDSEGFFVAAFKKDSLKQSSLTAIIPKKWPFNRLSKKDEALVCDYFKKQFGFNLSEKKQSLWQRDNEIWCFPDHAGYIADKIKVQRAGFKILELHKSNIRTQHDAAIVWGTLFTRQSLALSLEQTINYYQGKDVDVEHQLKKGECVLTYNGLPLGLGKVLPNKIKNNLVRSLVRDNPVEPSSIIN